MFDKMTTSPLEEWLDRSNTPGITKQVKGKLEKALKMCDKERIFPDGIKPVSFLQAIMCWRIVEEVRKNGFPTELEQSY